MRNGEIVEDLRHHKLVLDLYMSIVDTYESRTTG